MSSVMVPLGSLLNRAIVEGPRLSLAIRAKLSSSSSSRQQQARMVNQEPGDELPEFVPVTNKMEFQNQDHDQMVPMFRVLSREGELLGPKSDELPDQRVVELYKLMLKLNQMDRVLFDSQRQGRISFYMTSFGEEAAIMGSAAAFSPEDWIFTQYREAGAAMLRQISLRTMLAQCLGNRHDLSKGRQMPIHYGSQASNFVTVSSPLATQMPQAVGAAYSLRMADHKRASGERRAVGCYFGEGAASEGDAHAAMNFAATLNCPVVFLCRNNGFAISTPVSEQLAGDGILSRATGFGMPAIRVDGNDLLAVYAATRAARQLSVNQSRPSLVEMMTYRLGHHSTSDDSYAYRPLAEVQHRERLDNPLTRIRAYLAARRLWSEAQEEEACAETRAEVIEALNWAETERKPPVDSMFEDVYDEPPSHLLKQRQELRDHLSKFGEHYKLDEFEQQP